MNSSLSSQRKLLFEFIFNCVGASGARWLAGSSNRTDSIGLSCSTGAACCLSPGKSDAARAASVH